MNSHVLRIVLHIVLSAPLFANASKEGLLRLDTFQLTSPGIGQSGPVSISGMQDTEKFISFSVKAFDRTFSLSKVQLDKLQGGLINGLQLTYETGYSKLGGRTVHIVLSKGFTSGLEETQLITINEKGLVEVNDAVRK